MKRVASTAVTTDYEELEAPLLILIQGGILRKVPDRLRCHHLIETISSTPVLRLAADEGAHGAEVAFVSEEICLLLALGPEADGVGEGVHCLAVAADEGAAEVDVLDFVLFGLEVGDLANVVTGKC